MRRRNLTPLFIIVGVLLIIVGFSAYKIISPLTGGCAEIVDIFVKDSLSLDEKNKILRDYNLNLFVPNQDITNRTVISVIGHDVDEDKLNRLVRDERIQNAERQAICL